MVACTVDVQWPNGTQIKTQEKLGRSMSFVMQRMSKAGKLSLNILLSYDKICKALLPTNKKEKNCYPCFFIILLLKIVE